MLGKLVKYDLKWTYKLLIVFYILVLVFALIGRCLSLVDNSFIFEFLTQFSYGASIAMMFSIIINNLMRLWVRYINNVYRDEAYLTHTLPVEKRDIYLSKVITAVVTSFTSLLVIIVGIIICYYSKDFLNVIKSFLSNELITILGELIVVVFLELIFVQCLGFLAITLGYRSNGNKIVASLVIGFGIYMLSSIISVIILLIIAVFSPNLMALFINSNPAVPATILKSILIIPMVIYLVYIVVSNFIGCKVLKAGVNVD